MGETTRRSRALRGGNASLATPELIVHTEAEPAVEAPAVELSIRSDVHVAAAVLIIDQERFPSIGRHIVYLNGRYSFEIYQGKAYYSQKRTDGDSVEVSRDIGAKPGDVITLASASGKPGQSLAKSNVREIETITVSSEDVAVAPQLLRAVKSIDVVGTKITIALDHDSFKGAHRYVVRVNGEYAFESYAGKRYYSSGKNQNGTATLVKTMSVLKTGDEITVQLVSGRPGGAHLGTSTIATHIVK